MHLKWPVAGKGHQPRRTALVGVPTAQFAESEGDHFKCTLINGASIRDLIFAFEKYNHENITNGRRFFNIGANRLR